MWAGVHCGRFSCVAISIKGHSFMRPTKIEQIIMKMCGQRVEECNDAEGKCSLGNVQTYAYLISYIPTFSNRTNYFLKFTPFLFLVKFLIL